MLAEAKVFPQHRPEVLFRRSIGRAIVVREVKMSDSAVEGAADDGATGFKYVGPAEVLPEAERDGRQNQAGIAAAAEAGLLISIRVWFVCTLHRSSPLCLGISSLIKQLHTQGGTLQFTMISHQNQLVMGSKVHWCKTRHSILAHQSPFRILRTITG